MRLDKCYVLLFSLYYLNGKIDSEVPKSCCIYFEFRIKFLVKTLGQTAVTKVIRGQELIEDILQMHTKNPVET